VFVVLTKTVILGPDDKDGSWEVLDGTLRQGSGFGDNSEASGICPTESTGVYLHLVKT
jgi:hypothetical protein